MKVIDRENNCYNIKIDLSFFEGEKTEKPTGRKLEKAREEGQVIMSREVQTAILIICCFLSLRAFGNYIFDGTAEIMNHYLNLVSDVDSIFNRKYITETALFVMEKIMLICAPLFAVTMVTGTITNLAQVKWKITAKPLMPSLGKLSPISGFKRIFSPNSILELVKSLLKIIFISYVIYTGVKDELPKIQTLSFMYLPQACSYIFDLCIDLGLKVGIYFIIIAVIDYVYQRYRHIKKLKMSKQEIKDEMKSVEGDPQVKGKIRQRMRQISMRRMMQEVPNADVIITNPTHYAVALKYDTEKAGAPIVLAKGVDHLARRIKEVAKENKVEIVENKPLARALYNTVEIGNEIPPELYQAVAEVLAYVYRLRNA